MDGAGELDLLGGEVVVGVVGEQPRQQQQRVQRGAQLVAHVGQELGLVLAGLRELLGLLLDAAPGRVDLHVLDLDVAVLLGELLGLLLQLGVGPLQLGRLVLQLHGEPLGLREQLLGAPVGLDGGDRDADRGDQPLQERQVQRRERRDRAQLDHPEALALELDGQHDDRARRGPTRCRSGSAGSPRARSPRASDPPAGRRLPDEPLAGAERQRRILDRRARSRRPSPSAPAVRPDPAIRWWRQEERPDLRVHQRRDLVHDHAGRPRRGRAGPAAARRCGRGSSRASPAAAFSAVVSRRFGDHLVDRCPSGRRSRRPRPP